MKETGIIVAGAAGGAAIPLILREYVDKAIAPSATFDWKKPSALVGIVGGAALTALGLFGYRWVGSTLSTAFSAAGPAMLVSGAYCALFPKGTTTAGLRYTTSPVIKPAPSAGVVTY